METRSSPSMSELRTIAAERGLKYYLHLSKPELFALLQKKEGGRASTTLHVQTDRETSSLSKRSVLVNNSKRCMKGMRWSARLSLKKEMDAKKKIVIYRKRNKRPMNEVDPIMFTELGPHTFEFTRTNGSIVAYNVESLVQYILETGDFSEPETRLMFSDNDLQRIDYKAKVAKLNAPSVLEAKKNKHIFDERKVKRDSILALERCAGEMVTNMLNVIEDEDAEEGEMDLVMNLFPSFASIFNQLRDSDANYAKQCMDHYQRYIKGPPNRPNEDRSGLLPAIVSFLDSVLNQRQNESAFGF